MQSRNHNFNFDPQANIAMDSVFTITSYDDNPVPPVEGNFELLNGTPFLLLNGTNWLLM